MSKSIWLGLLAIATLGASPAPGPAPYTVGVVYWSMHIAGQVAMRQGLEREADAINRRPSGPRVRLESAVGGDGEAGVTHQRLAVDNLLARRPDALIIQPIDSAALAAPVRRANAIGVPVVAYDQYVIQGKLACYLTSNNMLAGRLNGEYLAHRFRHRTASKPLRLAIVEYPYVSSTVERVEGLQDALKESGVPYRIVGRYEGVEPIGGEAAGRRILAEHPPGTLDAVFCVNDGGGVAVMRVLESAGRKDVVMATIDGDPAAVAAIRRGGLIGIDTAQFCGPLGAEAMRWTYRLLKKEPVPRQVLLTVFPITRENVASYPGWMGPIPPRILKPWPPHAPVPGTEIVW
ncbi:D-ribose-binding periplasmic protein precursor [compost metagenome]